MAKALFSRRFAAVLLVGFAFQGVAAGQAASETVVATVNLQPIYREEVERVFRQTLKGRSIAGDALPYLQARTLKDMIDRKLVQRALERDRFGILAKDLEAGVDKMRAEVKLKGLTWEQYLAQTGMSEAALIAEFNWRRTWENYAIRHVTDPMLQKYFDAHRREFDGTELRVSHILLRPPRAGDAYSAEVLQQAKDLREKIIKKEITFADAVTKYSAGPSRQAGGDVGFIPRRGKMADDFSKAAFALKQGELSEPVLTSFGIHLLQWTEEKPGEKKLEDVRDEVRTAASQELFETMAAKERTSAKIEFTDVYPHFKPGTTELVTP